jgi:hypothetical protein
MTEKDRPEPTRQAISEQLMDIASEVAMLRESITTAAEWDLQARLDRQHLLDITLATVRRGQRILVVVNLALVGMNLALIGLALWLLARVGA